MAAILCADSPGDISVHTLAHRQHSPLLSPQSPLWRTGSLFFWRIFFNLFASSSLSCCTENSRSSAFSTGSGRSGAVSVSGTGHDTALFRNRCASRPVVHLRYTGQEYPSTPAFSYSLWIPGVFPLRTAKYGMPSAFSICSSSASSAANFFTGIFGLSRSIS